MKKTITILILAFSISFLQAQNVTRQVIGSAGETVQAGGNYYSYTIGEPIVGTENTGAMLFTQGFQQPYRRKMGGYTYSEKNETCPDIQDGEIIIIPDSLNGGTYSITWADGNTDFKRDSLKSGSYIFTLKSGQQTITDTIEVGLDSEDPCGLTIYSGFTPNGDGANDTWIIDGITAYNENSVIIFNRWGVKVWGKNNYDNNKTVWDGKSSSGTDLPDGTYFYKVKTDKKTYKGWVNIAR